MHAVFANMLLTSLWLFNGKAGAFEGICCVGNLHFVKFETSKISQCLDFIKSKNLHHSPENGQGDKPQMRVQATGGGAFKYADMFQVRLLKYSHNPKI